MSDQLKWKCRRQGLAALWLIGTEPKHRPYLWMGDKDDRCAGHISGKATLRSIAYALLAAIGEEVPAKKERR
jgi:hypothetical protein